MKKKKYFCHWEFAQLFIPTEAIIFMEHQPDVSEIQTPTIHTGLLLQVYIGEQVAGVDVANWEEKSISHASVFHKKAGKRSSVSMPIHTQACSVTYQHTYSQYKEGILPGQELESQGKPELTLFTQQPVLLPAHLFSLCFFSSCFLVQHIITTLTLTYYLPIVVPRLLPSHPKSLFSDQPFPLRSYPQAPKPQLWLSVLLSPTPFSLPWVKDRVLPTPRSFSNIPFLSLKYRILLQYFFQKSSLLSRTPSSVFLLEIQLMLSSLSALWKSTHPPHSGQGSMGGVSVMQWAWIECMKFRLVNRESYLRDSG